MPMTMGKSREFQRININGLGAGPESVWSHVLRTGLPRCLAHPHSHSQPDTSSCGTALLLPHWLPRTAGAAPGATAQLRKHDLRSGTMVGMVLDVLGCVPRGTAEVRFRLVAPETEAADKTGQDWLKNSSKSMSGILKKGIDGNRQKSSFEQKHVKNSLFLMLTIYSPAHPHSSGHLLPCGMVQL